MRYIIECLVRFAFSYREVVEVEQLINFLPFNNVVKRERKIPPICQSLRRIFKDSFWGWNKFREINSNIRSSKPGFEWFSTSKFNIEIKIKIWSRKKTFGIWSSLLYNWSKVCWSVLRLLFKRRKDSKMHKMQLCEVLFKRMLKGWLVET